MNLRSLFAIVIGVTALSVFPAQPRANAQETLTYWHYQPVSGSVTRQPRTPTSAQFVPFNGPFTAGGALVPGQPNNVFTGVTTQWPVPNTNPQIIYNLAFVSISGGAYGDITVFPDSTGVVQAVTSVTLPNNPNPQVSVNAYYIPSGGAGCTPGLLCGTAAIIDEFGESQGALLTDTFVSVYTTLPLTLDQNRTNTGNQIGSVDTTKTAVQIDATQPTYAYPATTPPSATGEIFDRWVTGPGGTIGSVANNLTVGIKTNDYALAHYHSACPSGTIWSNASNTSQCLPLPTCSANEGLNPVTGKCVPFTGRCPSTCKNGCQAPRIGAQGQTIWRCQPGECHGCPAGQTCMEWGYECNCLRCGNPTQPNNHPTMQ
jgi:hypothetical protein